MAVRAYNYAELQELGLSSIRSLETESGILASGKGELYGCVFGRDSLITSLQLLSAYEKNRDEYFLTIVAKVLRNLAALQGKEYNIESGEEPGKIIHEFRTEKFGHLSGGSNRWYVYPDNILRNYDTVDATPLFLLALDRYCTVTGSTVLAEELGSAVDAALRWLLSHDLFLTYAFPPERTHGGLLTQSWMDSSDSVFYEEEEGRPPYPIAPLEAQGYGWAALRAWGERLKDGTLLERAALLKREFNKVFPLRGPKSLTLAFALDGKGRRLAAPRSSMGHILWTAHTNAEGTTESILETSDIPALRSRLLARDLFVPHAGIRTLSNRSLRYNPMSYHNGSIWPHDTAILAEGLERFGFSDDARRVRQALLRAFEHFKTPVELFAWDKQFLDYEHNGQRACQVQAWSAASLLVALEYERPTA